MSAQRMMPRRRAAGTAASVVGEVTAVTMNVTETPRRRLRQRASAAATLQHPFGDDVPVPVEHDLGQLRVGVASRNHGGTDMGLGAAEILSDTQGVNFNPYLRRILQEIYAQWIPLIPEEARPPLRKSGTTMIRFTILPDGTIGAMHLDGSTHDDALNRAAWGSITGVGQFPALPSQFHGPNLELRIHYLVNQDTE